MIVGFVGAASTGKTSAAREVSKETGLPFHPSTPREVFKEFGLTEVDQHNIPLAAVYRLQQAIFTRKIVQDKSVAEGIFDRTPVDYMSYSMIRCHGIMSTKDFNRYLDEMIEGLKRYDLLFFFPISPSIKYESDGFRDASGEAYRYLQQFTMRGLLHKCGAEYIPITPTSSLVTRVRNIVNAIRQRGERHADSSSRRS